MLLHGIVQKSHSMDEYVRDDILSRHQMIVSDWKIHGVYYNNKMMHAPRFSKEDILTMYQQVKHFYGNRYNIGLESMSCKNFIREYLSLARLVYYTLELLHATILK